MLIDPNWVPEPVSPGTALVALELNGQDFPNFTLTANITKGLAKTVKKRDDTYEEEELHLKDRIRGLEECVLHYKENFNIPPEGYIKNQYYLDLTIPIGNRLFQPAKWIKLLNDGQVTMYTVVSKACANQKHIPK